MVSPFGVRSSAAGSTVVETPTLAFVCGMCPKNTIVGAHGNSVTIFERVPCCLLSWLLHFPPPSAACLHLIFIVLNLVLHFVSLLAILITYISMVNFNI